MFFHQQPQIAEVLIGEWKKESNNSQISFEKNAANSKSELIIKDKRGVFAECNAQEDSRNVFNCVFDSATGSQNKFDVYFAISHYYNDKLIIYYSFEPNVLDRCVQDDACTPDVLATLEREVKHDKNRYYYY